MQGKHTVILAICGLAAATGAGIWVMRGGDQATGQLTRTRVESPAIAMAPTPPELLAPAPPAWVPPTAPIVLSDPVPTPGDEPRERDPRGEGGDRGDRAREAMMRQFDTDGDGELSEAEREAARKQWESRANAGRELLLRRYDADGDGELDETERLAAREEFQRVRDEIRDRIVPEYDLDGDGELNDQEREAAGPAFRAEFQRIRTVALLDLDASGAVDSAELARALLAVGDGDESMDLNRDGRVDGQDAAYASSIAQAGN